MAEKEAAGGNILMPEIFVSNQMKQQRNYVHYTRNKAKIAKSDKAATHFGNEEGGYASNVAPTSRVMKDSLLLVVRIKGQNTTSP